MLKALFTKHSSNKFLSSILYSHPLVTICDFEEFTDTKKFGKECFIDQQLKKLCTIYFGSHFHNRYQDFSLEINVLFLINKYNVVHLYAYTHGFLAKNVGLNLCYGFVFQINLYGLHRHTYSR